jgi:hypothetical protein
VTTAAKGDDPFFVGYLPAPRRLALFAMAVGAALTGALAGLALALGMTAADPGDGRFDFASGVQRITGTVLAAPYPVLALPPSAAHPSGHTVMLAGIGKTGVQGLLDPLDGQAAALHGVMLKRGTLDMLQVEGDAAPAAASAPPVVERLGRWRLAGEICDGKCYAGAMQPGTGLAHKACANLCLVGGIPPVFVSAGAVEGTEYLMLGDEAGGPLPESYRDLTAIPLELEGEIDRIGDLLVFKVDLATARML